MNDLESIGERIHAHLEEKNQARDVALQRSSLLVRSCSHAIRAVHREERQLARKHLNQAKELVQELLEVRNSYPDLYFAGYSQDALKEYAEACIVFALIGKEALPNPEDLNLEYAAYLDGLGEAIGELRRRVLDILRHDHITEAERLLEWMDEIYGLLITVDFPGALTGNLRRITDVMRGVVERTRGDLTTSIQQNELKIALKSVEQKLDKLGKEAN
jgi:translin